MLYKGKIHFELFFENSTLVFNINDLYNVAGQFIINLYPEFKAILDHFGGIPLLNHHFG